MDTRRIIPKLALAGLTIVATALAGCTNSGGSGAGISTASILDGNPAAAAGEAPQIRNDDPMARSMQVAWTSARAQRCGFSFDAVKLKANYLASEARGGAQPATMASYEKSYDQTFTNTATRIKGEEGYCSDKKSATIKSELQRHLAGNYDPRLPEASKKVAGGGGFFEGLISDEAPDRFDQKNFWKDLEAKKNGQKSAQKSGE